MLHLNYYLSNYATLLQLGSKDLESSQLDNF